MSGQSQGARRVIAQIAWPIRRTRGSGPLGGEEAGSLLCAAMERKSALDSRVLALVAAAIALAVVVIVVLLTGGGDDGEGETLAAEGCETVEAPAPKTVDLEAPKAGQVLKRGEAASAVIETSCGSFTIALATENSPKTANSFAYLAEQGVFDDTTFHRIVEDFVIQGGDPSGDGTGGPGYTVREAVPSDARYEPGVVAMAKTGTDPPGTSGSQFFVVTGSGAASLPPEYAVLGEVSEGMDVVERIGALGDGQQGARQTVLIERVTIERD